jgi:hypothetical protein
MIANVMPFLAVGLISLAALLNLVVKVVIAGLIFWALMWAIDACETPQPFNKVLKVIIILFALIFILSVLFSLSGTDLFR